MSVEDQQSNAIKIFEKATYQGKMIGAWVFAVGLAICEVLALSGVGNVDMGRYFGHCGIKMRTGLPCPTCGFTTSAQEFFSGNVFEAFYIQPAAALLCVGLILTVFLAFITAVFGVYFPALKRAGRNLKIGYVILAVFIIIGCGWAVTLARALAERQ